MTDKIVYTKVDESNVAVQQLAKATGSSVKEVCGMLNQQRYRSAYNRQKLQQQKAMREFFKQHPEMMPKGE